MTFGCIESIRAANIAEARAKLKDATIRSMITYAKMREAERLASDVIGTVNKPFRSEADGIEKARMIHDAARNAMMATDDWNASIREWEDAKINLKIAEDDASYNQPEKP